MNQLEEWGWNASLDQAFQSLAASGAVAGRIVEEQRDGYTVLCASGSLRARAAGRLHHTVAGREELPAVGDWVVLSTTPDADRAIVQSVLPRRSVMVRKAAGLSTTAQVVAANVDTVLLVTALDNDLEPRRLERYLAAIWDSGATPVLVLSKCDLHPDAQSTETALAPIALGVPIVTISAKEGTGVEMLSALLQPRSTALLVGSSGVGKSTIVNRLAGADLQRVNEIRARDERGQHTTTSRRLLRLPSGALLVDTPGLRELALWDATDGLEDAFSDLTTLFATCRFRDCSHHGEPGCAVQAAIADGSLDPARLASWEKLQRELAHQASRATKRSQAQRKAEFKRQTMSYRARTQARKKR